MAVKRFLSVHETILEAQRKGKAIVALESTIVAHGMPYPENYEAAKELAEDVTAAGATPATIAVLDGKCKVGLEWEELERLAAPSASVAKAARRDLPSVLARGGNAATTVSGTMYIASLAGIRVFATGGIGGVHRGAEQTMDISSDLTELAKTPVAVVCAGAKSILDIPKTLEVLETQGVPVAAYKSDEFPAFFTPSSGCKAPSRVDTPEQAAAMIDASLALQAGGSLICVPIPAEHAAEGQAVEGAIEKAVAEAEQSNIRGADLTPFVLKRVRDISGGESQRANVALARNNARVAGEIAVELQRTCGASKKET